MQEQCRSNAAQSRRRRNFNSNMTEKVLDSQQISVSLDLSTKDLRDVSF